MPTSDSRAHFSALEDPRQSWKTLCPLPEALLIVLCGGMAGAAKNWGDFVEIERWAKRKQGFLHRLLPFNKRYLPARQAERCDERHRRQDITARHHGARTGPHGAARGRWALKGNRKSLP